MKPRGLKDESAAVSAGQKPAAVLGPSGGQETTAASGLAEAPAGFVLWQRRDRRQPWRPVAEGGTEAELTRKLAELPSGEYVTLPAGKHPNDRRS